MKRYSANIVITDINTKKINHVIEVQEGVIVNDYPFFGEQEAIEWVGGIIILSPIKEISDIQEMRISDFIDKYACCKSAKKTYAWHLSNIDITKDSIIRKENVSRIE